MPDSADWTTANGGATRSVDSATGRSSTWTRASWRVLGSITRSCLTWTLMKSSQTRLASTSAGWTSSPHQQETTMSTSQWSVSHFICTDYIRSFSFSVEVILIIWQTIVLLLVLVVASAILLLTYTLGRSQGVIGYGDRKVEKYWFAWRANQWLLILQWTLFSTNPPNNFLISVSNPWTAFCWADMAPFKDPQSRLVGCFRNYKDARTQLKVCCAMCRGPRIP